MSTRHVMAFAAAGFLACAHSMIQGTQVRDTPDNRQVLTVVHKAMAALRERDMTALLALISPRYFEDNGTADQGDDYGYQQLKDKILPEITKLAQEVQIDVEVQDIAVEGDRARADVRYQSRAQLALPAGTKWDSNKEFNRIELVREGGGWLIVGGL